MKGGKREGAARKKKVSKKPSSMATKKKTPVEKVTTIVGEARPNKHRSYLKVRRVRSGVVRIASDGGKDVFYLGTFDGDLIDNTFDQVCRVCFRGEEASDMSMLKANAALAAIIEIDPQDSTELMLATQMATVHHMAMEMSRRAMLSNQTDYGVSENINRMSKLMRTYTTQIEALNKYRNKGKQQITVKHQYVNVNDGGQAVIGDINQGGGNG